MFVSVHAGTEAALGGWNAYLPMMGPILINFSMHGMVYCDLVALWRSLQACNNNR